MKKVFCACQEKRTSYDSDKIYLRCGYYNKECPYDKLSKAKKKCAALVEAERE